MVAAPRGHFKGHGRSAVPATGRRTHARGLRSQFPPWPFPLLYYAAQPGKVWPMAMVSDAAESGLGR